MTWLEFENWLQENDLKWVRVPFMAMGVCPHIALSDGIALYDGTVLEVAVDRQEDDDSGECDEIIERIMCLLDGKTQDVPCILVHPEYGVYIGSFLGLGFWSKMDCGDQDAAVVFESKSDAIAYAKSWETQINGLFAVAVKNTHISGNAQYVSIDDIRYYW